MIPTWTRWLYAALLTASLCTVAVAQDDITIDDDIAFDGDIELTDDFADDLEPLDALDAIDDGPDPTALDGDVEVDLGDTVDDGAIGDVGVDLDEEAVEANLDEINLDFDLDPLEEDEPESAETLQQALPAAGTTKAFRTAAEIDNDEIVRRKAKELAADTDALEGREAFLLGEYDNAANELIAAELAYKEISKTNPNVLEKLREVELQLGELYEAWAEALVRRAQASARESDFDTAVEYFQKAITKHPERSSAIKQKIKYVFRAKEIAEFRQRTSPAEVDPEKVKRDYNIDVLLEQGHVLFNHRRYSDAREKYEQVLLEDPYNLEATRNLKRIYETWQNLAEERRQVMKAERIAEIRWKWNDPVTPLVSPETAVESTDAVRKISTETEGIRQKLNNIILPRITFEEASIDGVIKFLKSRSRELDPDGEGINIVLQLQTQQTADAPEEGIPGEFDGGGGFDDGGFDDGGFDGGGFDDGGFDNGGFDDPVGEPAAAAGPPTDPSQLLVSLELDNIPLGEAIRYVCNSTNLKHKVDPHAVIIAAKHVPFDEMEVRFYPVQAGVFETEQTRDAINAGDDFGFDNADAGNDDGDSSVQDPRGFFESHGVEFPDGAIATYNSKTSKLVVKNTPDNLRLVERILKELDIQPTQVTIEAKFVEISQTDLEELGFDWMFVGSGGDLDSVETGYQEFEFNDNFRFRVDKTLGTTQSLSGGLRFAADNDRLLQVNSILGGMQFNTVIRALKQKQSADILSAPKVTTITGTTATIAMVDRRQFPTSWTEPQLQAAAGNTNGNTGASFIPSTPENFEEQEIGVVLTVTPTVAADGYSIQLDLEPTVREKVGDDDYSYNIQLGQGGDAGAITATVPIRLPIISERVVRTSVIVWDGETVVLGGMIRENLTEVHDKVPFFGDIPGIKRLFQVKRQESLKRNLLIFVSARLVNPAGLPIRTADIRGLPDFRR